MKIQFLNHGRVEMASSRYRMLIPARELVEFGHDVIVSAEPQPVDIMIMGKHFHYGDHDTAHRVKSEGTRVVFDVCDDHFSTPHAEHYLRMIKVADQVVVPTPSMAEAVRQATGRDADIVYDPYEMPEMPAKAPHGRLLWFGHQSNWDTLNAVLPAIAGRPLEVVTLPVKPMRREGETQITKWSPENMKEAFSRAGIVIIPTTIEVKKQRKSANRMIESIRQGLFVCAGPLPAYDKLARYAHVGPIVQGIEWALRNPGEAVEKVRAGQAMIRKIYAPKRIAREWERVLGIQQKQRAA